TGAILSAGSYTVTVVDSSMDTARAVVTITQPAKLMASASVTTNVSCNGGSTGSASVTASGGTSPYNYMWSDGQTTSDASGLSAGTYNVTVTDSHGCTATSSVDITQPNPLAVTGHVISDVTCRGGSNGDANAI